MSLASPSPIYGISSAVSAPTETVGSFSPLIPCRIVTVRVARPQPSPTIDIVAMNTNDAGIPTAERLKTIPEEPDLVIKTGAERLSDFAIWQSVYAELYFTDVNWRDLRRREYLRAVLDFQDRQRRFGR